VTYHEPTILVDLLPTILDAVGIEPDAGRTIDGRSVLAALEGRRRVDRGDIFYYDDIAPDGHCNAVRRGEWKLHVNRVPGPYFTGRQFSATEQLPQLFNLRRDPDESYDLGEHHPEIVATLSARIAEFDAALRADQRARYG
jgi:arylsulfatase A